MHQKINIIIWKIFFLLMVFFLFYIVFTEVRVKNTSKEYQRKMFYMDYPIYIKLYGKDSDQIEKKLDEVENIYHYYHKITNRKEEYKNIHNLYYIKNNSSKEKDITIDKNLYDMLKLGLTWYEKSNHFLNIALGNANDRWSEYREKGTSIPTKEELQKENNDIKKIILKENNKIENNHVNIDLNFYRKGYATNKVVEYLKKQGITSYVIDIGGTIVVGDYYHKNKYIVGIEDPFQSLEISTKVKVVKKAISTVGKEEDFYEYKAKKYHFLLLPDTLFPPSDKESVTVIANDSVTSDLVATTLFLMDTKQGKQWISKQTDIEAMWYLDKNHIEKTENFENYSFS